MRAVEKIAWPAKFKVLRTHYVGKPQVVTEVRRPDPQAVLVMKAGDTITLSKDEYLRLFHRDSGPVFPPSYLELIAPPTATPPAPPAK